MKLHKLFQRGSNAGQGKQAVKIKKREAAITPNVDQVNISKEASKGKLFSTIGDTIKNGIIGHNLGATIGLTGRVNDIEDNVNDIKKKIGDDKSDSAVVASASGETKLKPKPQLTRRELKAVKMITRKEFWKKIVNQDAAGGVIFGGSAGAIIGFAIAASISPAEMTVLGMQVFLSAIGIGAVAGFPIGGSFSAKKAAGETKKNWLKEFSEKTEAENMERLRKEHPDIWVKLNKTK